MPNYCHLCCVQFSSFDHYHDHCVHTHPHTDEGFRARLTRDVEILMGDQQWPDSNESPYEKTKRIVDKLEEKLKKHIIDGSQV